MGLDARATDGRFGTNASRVAHKDLLIPQLEVVFLRETSAHWEQLLEAAGVPCAPINDLAQMLSQEQTKAINLIQPTRDSGIEVVALPISLNRSRPAVDTRAPMLGEHNQVINELLNAIAQG